MWRRVARLRTHGHEERIVDCSTASSLVDMELDIHKIFVLLLTLRTLNSIGKGSSARITDGLGSLR